MTSDLRPIVVVGDLMLDVSENGEANRLSPEAPVVVVVNPVATEALGGAGNAAANTASLGHPTVLVGAVGTDREGDRLIELVLEAGLRSGIVRSDQMRTTSKTRFLARSHQIMRLDREVAQVPPESHAQILSTVRDWIGAAGAVVLSDYAKGVITEEMARAVVGAAAEAGVPVVVDTKKTDVSCFAGATVIAPNHHEAKAITGEDDPRRAAAAIRQTTGGAAVVTLGADGMVIADGTGLTSIASLARSVADVTGAGDTVTAGLAVALAEGASVREAAVWANHAAAEAVSHTGTYAVPRSSVQQASGS
jgi:rfaE bifunctional protein kinase chain/domain